MIKRNPQICIAISCIFFFTSCVSRKKIVFFQGNQDTTKSSTNFEPIIQFDDLLYINVSSLEPEASAPFNLETITTVLDGQMESPATTNNNTVSVQKQTYLVDNYGYIEFPVIGSIKVAGYDIKQLREILKKEVSKYVDNPVIKIRIMNYKVSVLGEVNLPGVKTNLTQRITLPEALAMAGDLTLYGRRDNILLIRDSQGVKTYNRINITDANFVNSEFYYLDQNDVVYVEPRNAKINSTAIATNVTTIMSMITFITTLYLIFKK